MVGALAGQREQGSQNTGHDQTPDLSLGPFPVGTNLPAQELSKDTLKPQADGEARTQTKLCFLVEGARRNFNFIISEMKFGLDLAKKKGRYLVSVQSHKVEESFENKYVKIKAS